MSRGRVTVALGVVLVLVGTCGMAAVVQDGDAPGVAGAVREQGREYVRLFYVRDVQAIHDSFTAEMKESMSLDALRNVRRTVADKLGDETELIDEIVETRDGYVLYLRRAMFEKAPAAIDSRWILRDGKIAGLEFRPAPPTKP